MSIELRLSDIVPPAPEPHRTIYMDVVSMPNPLTMSPTYKAYNYDAVNLYFQLVATGAGWAFPALTNLGLINGGANGQFCHNQYGTRANPGAAITESITLTLKAYTDAAYTILKWTFARSVTVVFIKSDDGTWTQDFLDNFDDGLVDGWAVANEVGNVPTITVVNAYCLSVPNSVEMFQNSNFVPNVEIRCRLHKAFNTPNRNNVFAIANLRLRTAGATTYVKYVQVQDTGVLILYIGQPNDNIANSYLTLNLWMRVVVPLPKNAAVQVRIVLSSWGGAAGAFHYLNMDDFTIVSKN